jgi:pimeloyl-ACP methyl ester carboxylesterase
LSPHLPPDPWLDARYGAPQTQVRIGRRRRLNLLIEGQGAPTVIFAAGLNATALAWSTVQPAIARRTRTVAFDKAGMGFSDAGPLPRTAASSVDDLRAALAAANIPPPYVLVGGSAGGLAMRLFAFRHPEAIAGMVMVDSASEHQDRRMDAAKGDRHNTQGRRDLLRGYSRLAALARAGALIPGTPDFDRAVGAPASAFTPALYAAHVAQRTSPGFWRALRSESAASGAATSDQLTAARIPLGDMPLIVLTRGRDAPRPGETPAAAQARYAAWRTMHDEIAALSTRGQRRTVAGAGHSIQLDNPAAVITAIEEVLDLAAP